MQNAVLVGIVDGLGDGLQPARRPAEIRNPKSEIRNLLGQARTRHVVHREKELTRVFANLVDGDDVRMLQAGGGFRLGPKPGGQLRPAEGQHQLQSDDPVQTDLPGAIDDPHAAPGNFLEQLVVAKGVGRDHARRADP